MAEKDTAIPVGATPPQEKEDTTDSAKGAEDSHAQIDALSAKIENLQKVFDRQGNEIGTVRKENQSLAAQNAELKQTLDEMAAKTASSEDLMVADIYQQIEDGEVGLADGLRQLNERTRVVAKQEALDLAKSAMTEELSNRDRIAVEKQFVKENPDYMELLESGEIEKVRAKNPLHDNFSAFFEIRAEQAYEKGKADIEKVAKGAALSEKILTKPGAAIRQVNQPKRPLTSNELRQSGLEVLRGLRSSE